MFRRRRQCRAAANPGNQSDSRMWRRAARTYADREISKRIVAPAAVIAARPRSNEKRIIVLSGLLAMPE